MAQAPPMEPLHRALGLTDEEYERVRITLGRVPNRPELASFPVMGSEHCPKKPRKTPPANPPPRGPPVVAGIGGYGNCIGVPTVGGEVAFADCHSANPTVNVMCVGLASADRLMRSRAEGEGNLLVLIGSSTGRDGIGGVSVLASRTLEDDGERSEEQTSEL